ncbi:clostripain-related cysteine peptidase [Bacteroides finegoldii]|uniref:clostripain-related cysteine peptidase n=1 Tax=Bacteroides finegoldii TaxID=338188 RepID=UPI00189A1A79|nr:clostripain-related cysteine peptidase [Bacteroides finegoldii]
MTSKIWNWGYVLLICLCFMACSSDDDNAPPPPAEPEIDYVVMFYGCGGGNLDAQLMYNLEQLEGYGYSSKVRFTGLVKYSSTFQGDEDTEGTRLYNMTENGLVDEKVYDSKYRLDNPDHIADFIKSTKERLPAKKYILILWNHGGEFGFWDQPLGWSDYVETRGLVMDDNCMENGISSAISIFELEEGLKRSGVKLDMVYWDVCLMNMIENIYQIKDYTNYVMGAAHVTPGVGGHYTLLMDALENHADIPSAMKEYIPATILHWRDVVGDTPADLALIDMSKIDATVTRFKDVSDGFISMKRELKEDVGSQRELSFDYFMYYTRYRFNRDDSEGSTDMVSFVKALGNNMLDGGLSAKIAKFSKAMDDMILVRGDIGLQEYMSNYSLGLCVVTKDEYEREYESTGGGKAPKGLSVTYPLLHFAQATGWHNFLKINDWRPVIWNSETKEFEEVPM